MHLLIGIDDTDNAESRGTGFLSRQLAKLIEENKLCKVNGITRHQLFVHPDIAYTSQNSSACIEVRVQNIEEVQQICVQYLKNNSADGSDAGLCISTWNNVTEIIMEWGAKAKNEVLKLENAITIASESNTYLEGFTGTKIGQIGALAAVGLRKSGNDGRYIWLEGTKELRNLSSGVYNSDEFLKISGIENFISKKGLPIKENFRILCEDWIRPVLKDNSPSLILEKVKHSDYDWKTASKDYIRANS